MRDGSRHYWICQNLMKVRKGGRQRQENKEEK